jgi:hypothetical protein
VPWQNLKEQAVEKKTVRRVFFTLIALAIFGGTAYGQASDEVKRLKKERAELLDRAVGLSIVQYQKGLANFDALISVLRESRQAALDASADSKERIASLKAGLERANTMAKVVKIRSEVGVVSQLELLRINSYAIECRVDLLTAEEAAKANEKTKETKERQ